MYSPEEVFITDGYPEHTYVAVEEGQKERELREGLDQKNKIISISGPSKSGKTTLCERIFGADRVYITGDAIGTPENLWYEAYRQVTDDTDRAFYEIPHGERISRLIAADLPLIIDDFHYIPRDQQVAISRQMKNAASAGLRIICLSVPHRGDDPIRSNPDLAGRFFSVNFDFWKEEELVVIAETGFSKVGFPSTNEFNRLLAGEALKSPQIMQTLCLEACRSQDPDRPLENVVPTPAMLPEIIRRTLRSYNCASSLQILRQGPPTRGSERSEFEMHSGRKADVYQCIIEALKLDPPFLNLSLDDIRARIDSILVNGSSDPNVRSALQQYSKLFKEQAPPLDWDDEKRRLTIMDPHFYFYMRKSAIVD